MELLTEQTCLVLCLPPEKQQVPPAPYAGTWAAASGTREREHTGKLEFARSKWWGQTQYWNRPLHMADNPLLSLEESQPISWWWRISRPSILHLTRKLQQQRLTANSSNVSGTCQHVWNETAVLGSKLGKAQFKNTELFQVKESLGTPLAQSPHALKLCLHLWKLTYGASYCTHRF